MKYLVSIFSRLRFTSESIQLKMEGEEQGLGCGGGDAVGKRRRCCWKAKEPRLPVCDRKPEAAFSRARGRDLFNGSVMVLKRSIHN